MRIIHDRSVVEGNKGKKAELKSIGVVSIDGMQVGGEPYKRIKK